MSESTLDTNELVEYKLLNFADTEQTAACFSKIFIFEEPMTKSLGLSHQQFHSLAEDYCQLAAEDGLSYIAIEKATGNVIGFAICVDLNFDPARAKAVDPVIMQQAMPSSVLLQELDKHFIEKMDFLAGDCLHMFYTGIDSQFKALGIATCLAEKVLANAITKGYKFALAECTSLKSKKVLEKLGFREENRIVYADLHYNGPNPFENLEGYCALMVKELK
ncbi:hypothetical protein SOV_30400 [Sporomusa ovata DSM 2662]|uniref:N-acetyltransferase domain-containing protein n=1 Tax=Sporomusa ovata TaxID=2378 RepID=A0A0U1L327_9FIRM|nr:hypothetical protein [Sporomusa ovata]EQB24998.1 hypothetical protein SOV_5c01440 [Sporomusa ovata DSM 2662]CQR73543.1 hypothetical protein SpAn4DRAFT_0005 [Sporomusa ovata]